jgi:hypothetical protein
MRLMKGAGCNIAVQFSSTMIGIGCSVAVRFSSTLYMLGIMTKSYICAGMMCENCSFNNKGQQKWS